MARQGSSRTKVFNRKYGLVFDRSSICMLVVSVILIILGCFGIGPKWEIEQKVYLPVNTGEQVEIDWSQFGE